MLFKLVAKDSRGYIGYILSQCEKTADMAEATPLFLRLLGQQETAFSTDWYVELPLS